MVGRKSLATVNLCGAIVSDTKIHRDKPSVLIVTSKDLPIVRGSGGSWVCLVEMLYCGVSVAPVAQGIEQRFPKP